MQIQQLKYLIAAAEEGSFRSAANKLFVSQSSISLAIKELERETDVVIFRRTPRGITLTSEGTELLEYARNVVEQMDSMEQRYAKTSRGNEVRLAVSSQHYSLVVDAFGDFLHAHSDEKCEFTLLECNTTQIMRDVAEYRSDLGFVHQSNHNDQVIERIMAETRLVFTPLYAARPHIVVRKGHTLAQKSLVDLTDLEGMYRFEQAQGLEGSTFFAEEPLSYVARSRRLVVSDNGTLASLIARTDGYTIGTGAFLDEAEDLVSIPIDTDERMTVGLLRPEQVTPSPLAEEFLHLLAARIVASVDKEQVLPATLDLLNCNAET